MQELQDQYDCCAGIDVHKQSVSVCVLSRGKGKAAEGEVRNYGTTTRELVDLSLWLQEQKVEKVVMESTGVYWKPVRQVLESEQIEAIVANAQHVKNVPGRKTDTADCAWLATLLKKGLVRASLVPTGAHQQLRDLSRSRVTLVQDRARAALRIQKLLEEANVKLASVATDVLGVSGRAMLKALAAGKPTLSGWRNWPKGS
jgi:transposase